MQRSYFLNQTTLIVIIMLGSMYLLVNFFDRRNLRTENIPETNLVSSLNFAPHVAYNKNLCRKSKLWGTPHGGGWMVCLQQLTPTDKECIVYSYGLGADWTFDIEAEKSDCVVHGFDPTGAMWRQGAFGEAYSRIDYAASYPSKKKIFHNWEIC